MKGMPRGFVLSLTGVKLNVFALGVVMLVLSSTSFAIASPIIFTASGTAGDGRPDNGKATINFLSNTQMTIQLENTAGAGQLAGISSVLDGFSFTFSTAPTSIALTSVVVGGDPIGYNCVTGSCVGLTTLPVSSPYDWGAKITGSWSLTTPLLAAGNGSYKPYGIVNDNIQREDGIKNAQHNPYLNGPVTFTLTLGGLSAIPDIPSAKFYFGTGPDIQPGVRQTHAPIPGAVWLLGSGLVGLVGFRRKFLR